MPRTPRGPSCYCAELCGCYVEGYAQGKDKAHFEVRQLLGANHATGCGCEPCKTVQAVLGHPERRQEKLPVQEDTPRVHAPCRDELAGSPCRARLVAAGWERTGRRMDLFQLRAEAQA